MPRMSAASRRPPASRRSSATGRRRSGRQRERVAVGPALARDPTAVLRAAPPSALDARLRFARRAGIADPHARRANLLWRDARSVGGNGALGPLRRHGRWADRAGRVFAGRRAAPADTSAAVSVDETAIPHVPIRLDNQGRLPPRLPGLVMPDAPPGPTLGMRPEALRLATEGAHASGRIR